MKNGMKTITINNKFINIKYKKQFKSKKYNNLIFMKLYRILQNKTLRYINSILEFYFINYTNKDHYS